MNRQCEGELAFDLLFRNVCEFKKELNHTYNVTSEFVSHHLEIITKSVESFKEFKTNNIELDLFIDRNDIELFRIHDALFGFYSQVQMPKFRKLAKVPHDILFEFLAIDPLTHFKNIATKICQEFFKGITLFENGQTSKLKTKECEYIERLVHDQIYMDIFNHRD